LADEANHGTLFLDEIADLDLSLQAKLLHLLQDGHFCRIGGHSVIESTARILCATSRDLAMEVKKGTFREDLYYRINTVTLRLPRLTERRKDIPLLAHHFIRFYTDAFCAAPCHLSDQIIHLLMDYEWPGNIRQLENVIKTFVVLGSEESIRSALTPVRIPPPPTPEPALIESTSLKDVARQATRELERKMILDVLRANQWNRKATARQLNISYRSLFYKIHEAGVPPKNSTAANRKPAANAGKESGDE
jgi:two-component system response regulator AtoC